MIVLKMSSLLHIGLMTLKISLGIGQATLFSDIASLKILFLFIKGNGAAS